MDSICWLIFGQCQLHQRVLISKTWDECTCIFGRLAVRKCVHRRHSSSAPGWTNPKRVCGELDVTGKNYCSKIQAAQRPSSTPQTSACLPTVIHCPQIESRARLQRFPHEFIAPQVVPSLSSIINSWCPDRATHGRAGSVVIWQGLTPV